MCRWPQEINAVLGQKSSTIYGWHPSAPYIEFSFKNSTQKGAWEKMMGLKGRGLE